MADRKTRWQKADENFRFQVKVLMAKSGLSVSKIGSRCNVSHTTMYHYMNCPAEMPKRIERYLTLLFEEHGLRYDPTLGEGAGA